MKKKNLKSLSLNKKVVSSLKPSLQGGRNNLQLALTDADVRVCNLSIIDGSNCMSQGGCTSGPDETMTCAAWSCICN